MSKASKDVSIQLKRNKQTFMLVVKPTSNATIIKKELHSIIQAIGGIGGESEDGPEANGDDADIDIPIPTFGTTDSDEEDNDEAKVNDITSASNKTIPSLEHIALGEPRDKSDPYGSGFKEIKDVKKGLDLKDSDMFAFKLADEDEFEVVEPVDIEE